MLASFEQHVNQHFPFLKDKKLLIAVSGGMDSVVLTHLLKQLGYNISIAHCNFQLRVAESKKDAVFVKELANELAVKVHLTKFNTKEYCKTQKVSIQIGARNLRYHWFDELAATHNYDFIITAHHLNDVIETFFINLSRGTGLDGLLSIPAINNNIVRPLLPFSRTEINNFALTNQITWREDSSNAETKYLRNKIRHNLVPEFYNLNSNFEANFKKTLHHLYQNKAFINAKIAAIQKTLFTEHQQHISIDKEKLRLLSEFEIYELFKPYGFTNVTEITKLRQSQTGKEIQSATHSLLVNREQLLLYPTTNNETTTYWISNFETPETLPISLQFSSSKLPINKNTIAIHLDHVAMPLQLRKWKPGDVFYPTGMTGKKKISNYFKDQKFSKLDKASCWLLCNAHNEIIWIVGYRADRTLTTKSYDEKVVYIKKT